MKLTEYALIVAGGKGTRMKTDTPKQFLELNGLPVIFHTIEAFYRYSSDMHVVVVLPESEFDTWRALAKKYAFNRPVILQHGGATRFQSVKKGLEKITTEGIVAIHDGVRPLVHEHIIGASFQLAAIHRSAVAAVRLKESLRMTDQTRTMAVDRSQFRLIQTPQTFLVSLIKKAYEIPEDETLTDDASVAERSGLTISLFEGSYRNIKITTEEDLVIAEALLKANRPL